MALLQGVVNEQRVKSVAGRLIECFERVLEELPKDCCITCSIGIAVCPRDGENFQTLFRRADVALYQAKACGKSSTRSTTSPWRTRRSARERGERQL